ncbi:MAG: GspE/PulE family protein, partial [bacterium]
VFTSYDFNHIKSKVYNIDPADLSEVRIENDVISLLPAKVAENYQMIVFGRDENQRIQVGLVNPGDFKAHEAMDFLVQQQGLSVKYSSISLEDFKNAFRQYSGYSDEIGSAVKVATSKYATQEKESFEGGAELQRVIKTAPVAKIVTVIIRHAIDGHASDIHIEPGREQGRVRYRVDGILHTSLSLPNFLHTAVVSRIKVLANLKLDENRIPQDGRIRINLEGQDIDLRVSVLPMLDAEKVVLRILDSSAGIPSLAALGFSANHIEIIQRNIKKAHGLFLLTGPTGSGKTTTLYSILNMLNGDASNITTLEDPIEYYINGINQSQIRPEVDFTFSKGLRAILRQDPNIVMVGEIRDDDTAELAIHAALTGHLIFSTLHTNDALGAVPRLADMKVEPFLLSSTLNLVMAQRLVRTICPDCRQEIILPEAVKKDIELSFGAIPEEYLKEFKGKYKFYRGVGCINCSNTGYTGRSVICEIFEVNDSIRQLINSSFAKDKVMEGLKSQKFISLMQDGIIKALQGITTIDEVLRIARE